MPVYDLTIEITPKTNVFPGDPMVKIETISDVAKGDTFTLRHYHFGNHTGTHIDFPAHIIKGGKCSSDYSLEYLMGDGRVVEIPDDGHVTVAHVKAAGIKRGEIVFFKTSNTRRKLHSKPYTSDFVAIEDDAAIALATIGVKMVGIDYLSVDKYEEEELPTHHALLGNGVLVVENVDLDGVPAGEYHISVAPLRVKHADGLPVRVTACTTTVFADKPKAAAEAKEKEEATEYEKNRARGRSSQIKLG